MQLDVLGSGPALLMLHGAGGTARDNFPFLDELAQSFTVLAPSLTCAAGESADDLAGQVLNACREVGVSTFSVCGYSMGTTIAAAVAARAGGDVQRVALCAGFAYARPSLRLWTRVWRDLLNGPPEVLGSFLASVVFSPVTLDGFTKDQLGRQVAQIGESQTASARFHLDLIDAVDTRRWMEQGSYPLLLVVPEQDKLVHPGHSDDLFACRPDAERVHLPAGHALGDEAPTEWLASLRSFFTPS